MKNILLPTLLLLLFSCSEGKISAPKLEECLNGNEKACQTLPESNDEVEENTLPVVVEEEEEHKPYYYNHSLYIKKFTFWGYNFKQKDRMNKQNYTVFKSSNTKKEVIGSQYIRVYAQILFKNDEPAKIEYVRNSDHHVVKTQLRDWVIYDDMEFHIDGYKQGEFAWHSKITPTLKTQNEIDDGVLRYSYTNKEYLETNCAVYILDPFTQHCIEKYLVTDVYSRYYFD